MEKDSFISGRIKSLKFAVRGFVLLLRTEHAIMVHAAVFLIFCVLGFWVGISREEWIYQLLAFGLLLSVEALNTAIEKICDFVQPNYDHRIGFIKDISAGAVTFAFIFAFFILLLTYWPYF